MNLDAPADTGTVAPPVRVTGWAYSRDGIDSVTVIVDGVSEQARYGLPRTDVAFALDEPGANRCGFTLLLDDRQCGPGPHQLDVVAVDMQGRATGVTRTVAVNAVPAEGEAPPQDLGPAADPIQPRLDNGGERYVPELHEGAVIQAEHQARYACATQLAQGRDVLDAGCGVGWGTALLADAGAKSVIGLDTDEHALADARARSGGKAAFVRGDILALPFDDRCFDLAACFDTIEHVGDPDRALDELFRILRPDGILAISSPNRDVYPSGNPFHKQELTSAELEGKLRSRFRNVVIYRQRTLVGSIVAADELDALGDPTKTIDARLHKLFAGAPGDELHMVAFASEGKLPAIQSVAFLGRQVELKQFYERIAMLEDNVLLAEAKLSALEAEFAALRFEHERTCQLLAAADRDSAATRRDRTAAEHRLAEHLNFTRWRVTAPLRAAKDALRRLLR